MEAVAVTFENYIRSELGYAPRMEVGPNQYGTFPFQFTNDPAETRAVYGIRPGDYFIAAVARAYGPDVVNRSSMWRWWVCIYPYREITLREALAIMVSIITVAFGLASVYTRRRNWAEKRKD